MQEQLLCSRLHYSPPRALLHYQPLLPQLLCLPGRLQPQHTAQKRASMENRSNQTQTLRSPASQAASARKPCSLTNLRISGGRWK